MAVSQIPKHLKYVSVLFLILLGAVPVAVRFWVGESQSGSDLFALSTAVCCGISILSAIPIGRRLKPTLPVGLPSVTFSASVCGFVMVTVVVMTAYYSYFAPAKEQVVDVNPSIALLVELFALGCAVYFLLMASWMALSERKAFALFLALLPVLFCAFRILNDFIDHSTMPLADHGGYRILGIIATMLFFLREAKLRTGKGGAALYFVLGQVTVILLAAYNVPLLWEFLHGEATVTEVLYAMLSVAFIIYIFTRIFSLEVKPKEEAPAPVAEEA